MDTARFIAAMRRVAPPGVNFFNDKQGEIASAFGSNLNYSESRKFGSENWREHGSSLPLLKNAAVSFCCSYSRTKQFGTHRILIGKVLEAISGDATPALWFDGEFIPATQ